MKDVLNIALFLIAVVVGAWLVNLFIFRSFNVDGPSMEKTLYTGDRLIVNRLPVTWEHLRGRQFIPNRGQIVVFKNPFFEKGMFDEYIVKRVIAFPGERVVLKDRKMLVYNKENPSGLDVDMLTPDVVQPTHGSVDMTVKSLLRVTTVKPVILTTHATDLVQSLTTKLLDQFLSEYSRSLPFGRSKTVSSQARLVPRQNYSK